MTREQILTFLSAGKAVFTLKSLKTGDHYTYKIERPTGEWQGFNAIPPLFARVLSGEDQWSYLGIYKKGMLILTKKSPIASPSSLALRWFLSNMRSPQVEFMHAGRCARCGRVLTHPESIASGLGPECEGRATGLTKGQRSVLAGDDGALTRQLQRSIRELQVPNIQNLPKEDNELLHDGNNPALEPARSDRVLPECAPEDHVRDHAGDAAA